MAADSAVIPRTIAVLESGMDAGLHVGAQLCVAIGGEVIADLAIGAAGGGRPLVTTSMLPWFSMTKAVTSVAALQQWERGAFDLDDPVADYVPEFGAGDKNAITIRQLLTHTGGFRYADGGFIAAAGRSWDETIAIICAAQLEKDWIPGQRAGYHGNAGMQMLGEIIRRVDGRPFPQYVREAIFLPLAMRDCWIGMQDDAIVEAETAGLIATMHNTKVTPGEAIPGLDAPAVLARSVPGGGGRGPVNQLVRLYQALLGRGELDGVRVLSPQTVDAMLARHRVGMFDETFNALFDWGLGLHVDTIHFGRHCSRRAAGHGGAQSSIAGCDPEYGLAFALVCNGMAGAGNSPRMEAISTALYVDLGLAAEDDAGRDHPRPRAEA